MPAAAFPILKPNFHSGGLEIDFAARLVSLDGVEIHLTPKEFDLLRYMSANPNRVLTHVQITDQDLGTRVRQRQSYSPGSRCQFEKQD